ncbi:MAG TPA: hypothetical protein PLP86_11355 [Armatimonadota bacterium]|nr:hypothetical protein [Armatimonadota bacterium]
MGSHYNRVPMTKDKVLAAATPAQTVIVQAGESLQDAIDSITDATSEKTYLVLVYPGVSRSYTPKDNVNVVFLEDMGGGGTPDDGSVTAAKLDDALAAILPESVTFSISPMSPGAYQCDVSIQLKDAKGNNIAATTEVRLWLSDTPGGTVASILPNNAEVVTAGVQLYTYVSYGHWAWLSNESGVIAFTLINTAFPRTYYINVSINGRVYTSPTAVRFQEPDPIEP